VAQGTVILLAVVKDGDAVVDPEWTYNSEIVAQRPGVADGVQCLWRPQTDVYLNVHSAAIARKAGYGEVVDRYSAAIAPYRREWGYQDQEKDSYTCGEL
jgi:hypothetical protein